MEQTQRNPVIRRKLGVRPPTAEAAQDAERHLAKALARATSRIPGLVGSCATASRRSATLAELLELVDSDAFAGLIADPSGAMGLAIFDPVASVALIEAMTVGRLSRTPPPQRRATQTDAQLLSELIDAALAEFDAHAPDGQDHGFRFLRFPTDYRLLELILESPRFDLFVQPLSLIGDDVRRDGRFVLALPEGATTDSAPAPATEDAADRRAARTGQGDAWSRALQSQVMTAPAQLQAVLGRITLSLSDVMKLGVGSQLSLPLAKLEEVEIEALDGQVIGLGRLGQYRAMRAIRLVQAGDAGTSEVAFEDHAVPARVSQPVAEVPATDPPAPNPVTTA
ncbi:FliM/FliN family flagellar motor C-terminal domain-containing protein [Pararhodobacter sp. SW119]|uniref:FliM/FliN family flagellar motor C-terminal domain-containing protein n=1 Tax=Pararhodobacter sp. SW119 TaxID=2780075 RepID=UPI001ADF8FB5|nr:FliM/FliN family flagellar motor C-terminal domain-containing protein [Pararhodobacter sp. SW119]